MEQKHLWKGGQRSKGKMANSIGITGFNQKNTGH